MEKIREWAFPVCLIAVWMVASAYTVSLMIEPPRQNTPAAVEPAVPALVADAALQP